MRAKRGVVIVVALSVWAAAGGPAAAQTRRLSDAECRDLRVRIAEHALLSDGVRRMVAGLAPAAAPLPAARPAPSDRAAAIRARLEQIPAERVRLEDQRLGAMLRFEIQRAAQISGQIDALDAERRGLERELAGLPATAAPPAAEAPPPRAESERIRCQDAPAAHENAVKIRQRELGAREGLAGVVPLVALRGQGADQIARELAAQFAAWPDAAGQVGLLDQDGDGRLDGFVDVPGDGVFRLYRQRGDGTVSVDVFAVPGRGSFSEMVRRLDEATARQTRRALADLLQTRPAGPVRTLAETAEFGKAHGHFHAGNFADAGRVEGAAARSLEFPNFRGETVRVLEIFMPAAGGVAYRGVSVLPRPGNQEAWEELTAQVRPASYWRTDVEVTVRRETRSATGALVGQPATAGPIRFSLER